MMSDPLSDAELDAPIILTQRIYNQMSERYAYLETLITELRVEYETQDQ